MKQNFRDKQYCYNVRVSIFDNTKYDIFIIVKDMKGWSKKYLDTPQEIANEFEVDVSNLYRNAKLYDGIVRFNKYLGFTTIMFDDKKMAKKFLKEYLVERVILLYKMSKI